MSYRFEHIEIVSPSSLARNGVPHGQVVHASGVTLSSGLGETTASAAGRFGPPASLLVDHDTMVSLTPRALLTAQIGSVSMRSNRQDTP